MDNKTLVAPEQTVIAKHTFKDLQKEYTCMYCGEKFPTKGHLGWHLPKCKERAVKRDFHVGDRVFSIYLNPRKDVLASLMRIARDLNLSEMDNRKKEERFFGAYMYVKEGGFAKHISIKRHVMGMVLYFPEEPRVGEPSYKHWTEDIKAHQRETEKYIRAEDEYMQTQLSENNR